MFFVFSLFPETAVTGDTFAALFAGELAAISTVVTPNSIPLIGIISGILLD